jgi:hypothetical protein
MKHPTASRRLVETLFCKEKPKRLTPSIHGAFKVRYWPHRAATGRRILKIQRFEEESAKALQLTVIPPFLHHSVQKPVVKGNSMPQKDTGHLRGPQQ